MLLKRECCTAVVGLLALLLFSLVAIPSQANTDTASNSSDANDAAAVEPAEVGVDPALARLRDYVSAGEVYHAEFIQSVYGENGDLVRESTGDVSIAPPNRFRWIYKLPFPQLIVSNGEELYLYDEDLAQVTVYDSNSALKSSPTLMFRDPEALERSFVIRGLDSQDGMQWIELVPRDEDADFQAIYVALDSAGMRVLEMRDKLGQATQIRFDHLQVTRSVNDALFEFDIPDGTDVIRP